MGVCTCVWARAGVCACARVGVGVGADVGVGLSVGSCFCLPLFLHFWFLGFLDFCVLVYFFEVLVFVLVYNF